MLSVSIACLVVSCLSLGGGGGRGGGLEQSTLGVFGRMRYKWHHRKVPHLLEDSREQSPSHRKSAEYKASTQFLFVCFVLLFLVISSPYTPTPPPPIPFLGRSPLCKLFTMMTHFSLLYWPAILSDERGTGWGTLVTGSCLVVRLLDYIWSKESPAATTERSQNSHARDFLKDVTKRKKENIGFERMTFRLHYFNN